MRVSDLVLYDTLADSIDTVTSDLNVAQQQLATGKSVMQPSDNPAAFAQAEILQTSASATSNDASLANLVQNSLNMASDSLSQASTVINSAIANANEGANGTVNASQMTDIAQTVQGQLAQLIQSANTNYAGVYLFAGNQTQAAPFSAAGAYAGDAGTNSASFSNGAKIQVTFDGQSIFGNATSGAIGAMTSLVAALNAGNQTAVAATIPQLNAALQQIAGANASIGTSVNNASALATNSTSAVTTINNSINQVAGADVAQVAINVQEDTAEQQALVSLASEIGKMPLINILA
ncbi:MAG: hypothetical protein ABSD31_00705 [Candidatus Binataceae bacterium]|jgi:flagellar hook-associated protein 3 FlgL